MHQESQYGDKIHWITKDDQTMRVEVSYEQFFSHKPSKTFGFWKKKYIAASAIDQVGMVGLGCPINMRLQHEASTVSTAVFRTLEVKAQCLHSWLFLLLMGFQVEHQWCQ